MKSKNIHPDLGCDWDDENYRKIDLSFHSGFIPRFKIFNT
jgi:hypothetical protein